MILYHGGLERVEQPEIRVSNRYLDFGTGFYATSSYQQAEDWVRRKVKELRGRCGYVNKYELNANLLDGLKCLCFDTPTEEWLDFVMSNRTDSHFTHDYDVVYGPVANDRVYAAFALYEGGLLNKQNLIAELKTYKLVDQYLFHSNKSLTVIKFVEAKQILL